MRKNLGNILLTLVSVVFCLVLAEGATRIIDGLPPIAIEMPQSAGSLNVDPTAGYLDKVPRAPGVDRALFLTNPPPLPNRSKPPQEWLELDEKVKQSVANRPNGADSGFQRGDMFKAWNAVLVGDPCTQSFFREAPGRLWVYDPPDGKPRPSFRFLPNATAPDGLVTNAYGWRGPPVPFARPPRTIRIVFVGASTTAEIHHYPSSGPEFINNWLNEWAAKHKLDVRFEVMNAGRESVLSGDMASIVRYEVAPLHPDLVFYYEGGNQLQLGTVVKNVPKGVPMPRGLLARWLREAAPYSALARRAQGLTVGREWPKPDYEITWPEGLSETDPDITRTDLPVNLNNIIGNLDQIRADLAKVGGELAVGSFHWLAKDGLVLNSARDKPILDTLNVSYYPFRYRDLERLTTFENRVFAKYAAARGIPFIDVARYMPYDPDLFSDAIHNTPAGVRLRSWIVMQLLVPVIEKHLADGTWPQSVPDMGAPPTYTPRQITFSCPAS